MISEVDIRDWTDLSENPYNLNLDAMMADFIKRNPEHDAEKLRLLQPTNTWTTPGVKHDADKPPMALLDSEYLEGVSRVLGFGANKYAPDNWRGGIQYRRLISAAYRHLGAINRGEDVDPETGELHAYHLGCCNMFLASMMNHRPDMDDRWKP